MDKAEILRRFDSHVRTRADAAPGFEIVWDGPVLRMTGPDREAHSNGVLYARLDEASADAAIAQQVAFFRKENRAFEWKLFDYDEPGDLCRRLEEAGLVAQAQETFVAFDVSGDTSLRAPPPEVRIRRIDDPADFGVIATVNEAAYGKPDHSRWLAAVTAEEKRADPDALFVYAAFVDEEPISVGWMRHLRGEAFGSLWGGSTLREWRGRGVYSAIVGARVAQARQRGCRWLTVDCSPMSLPILTRCGFESLAVITPYVFEPAARP